MAGAPITPSYWGQGNTTGNGTLVQPYSNTGSGNTLINPYLPAFQVAFDFWQKPVYQDSQGAYWTPGIEGATYSFNPWDYVEFLGLSSIVSNPLAATAGSIKTPGICTVDVEKEASVDEKKPSGSNGGRLTVHGLNLGRVTIAITIWTPEQLRQLQIMWDQLFAPSGKQTPTVAAVSHPVFTRHGIASVQFLGGKGPVVGSDRKGVFTIKAVEFSQPSTKNVTKSAVAPLGSIYSSGANPLPSGTPGATGP